MGQKLKVKRLQLWVLVVQRTAIQVQCALDGAREISIFNPKDDFYKRAEQTVENIKKDVPECVVNLYDLEDTNKLYEEIQSSDILTNATLIGMKPYDNETNIKDTSVLRKDLVVTDVVYNPKKTKMIEDAEANGCKAIGGLGMLLYQGAEAFNLYTGLEMPVEEVNELCFKQIRVIS